MTEMNSDTQSANLVGELQQLLEAEELCRQNRDRIVAAMKEKVAMLQAILSPCSTCSNKEKCKKPCERLETKLPGKYAGRIHGERTISVGLDNTRNDPGSGNEPEEENVKKLDQGALKSFQKVSSINIFAGYDVYWHIFSKEQRKVLVLFHRDGKNITQIAEELDKAPSTVHGLLKRADQRRQRHYRKQ